jgi:hypothetical protein
LVRTPVLPYLLTDPFGFEWNPLNLPHMGDPPVVSQVPMLALMMAYTILGLWVISLPFALTGRG